jgi:hypothetical protein
MSIRSKNAPLPKITNLPKNKNSQDYFRALVNNCIAAYARTYNDKLSLDYNQVMGKMRSMVLDDEEYQKQTRSLRARRIIEEAEELDALEALAEGIDDYDEDDPDSYDPRKKKSKKTSADKDEINLRFKLAQERRSFLKLDSRSDETDETEALNLFFVPVTREEMAKLETAEINDGEYNVWEADESDGDKRLNALLSDAVGPKVVETLYVTNEDGTIEEL